MNIPKHGYFQARAMRRLPRYAAFTAACALALAFVARRSESAPPAAKKPAQDVSGEYSLRGSGYLRILQGPDELWLSYEDEWGAAHLCECVAQAKPGSGGNWQITGDLTGTLAFTRGKPTITPDDSAPDCCGAGWPGVGKPRGKPEPPRSCAVKAEKLPFQDREGKPTKTYVIAGDHVDTVALPGGMAEGRVIARFVGKKKTTIGFVAESGLSCGAKP